MVVVAVVNGKYVGNHSQSADQSVGVSYSDFEYHMVPSHEHGPKGAIDLMSSLCTRYLRLRRAFVSSLLQSAMQQQYVSPLPLRVEIHVVVRKMVLY